MTAPVLVDTSVWVEHFRRGVPALVELLLADAVLMHPWVRAEIACGTPPAPRAQTLGDLARLRAATVASEAELLTFIERGQLHGRGCGMVGLGLLAATRLTPLARLWTLDRRLAALAAALGVAFAPRADRPGGRGGQRRHL